MKYREHELSYFSNVHNQSRIPKFLYLVLSLQVTLLAVVYHTTYPLNYPHVEIFQAYGYWFLIASMILTSALLAYYVDSAVNSFVSTLAFYVALNSHQLLYYSVAGGDVNNQIMQISLMSRYTHVRASMSSHFDYLTWPANYVFALVVKKTYNVDSAISTIDIGYAIYFLLFVIAVWVFFYRFGDDFLAYVASIAYLVVSFTALNNQFVPQFLALILLFFLFTTMGKEGRRWRVVELTLFVTLVFTHLVFPVFYLVARTLRPGITSLLEGYRSESAYAKMYDVVLHPAVLVRRTLSPKTWRSNNGIGYVWVLGLWTAYFVKNNPFDIYTTAVGPKGRTGGDPILEILSDLGSSGSPTATVVAPLHRLVPQSLDLAVTWGGRLVVLTLFGVLVLSLLYSELDDPISAADRTIDYRIEVVVACAVLFGLAWALNTIYGTRVLQVAFLPIAIFFYGLRKHRRTVVVLIVCLSLLSPVLLVNSYANNTLSAGGNTIGHQETQAGMTVGAHYDDPETVVAPPHTPYPVGSLDDMRNNDIRVLADGGTVPESNLLIFSDRFDYFLNYRGYDCQVDGRQRNVVYDNGDDGAQAVWDGGDGPVVECLGELQRT